MRSAALVDGMHGGLMVKPCWQLCLGLCREHRIPGKARAVID